MLSKPSNKLTFSSKTYLAFVARSGGGFHYQKNLPDYLEQSASSSRYIHIKSTYLSQPVLDSLADFRVDISANANDATAAGKTTGFSGQLVGVIHGTRAAILGDACLIVFAYRIEGRASLC